VQKDQLIRRKRSAVSPAAKPTPRLRESMATERIPALLEDWIADGRYQNRSPKYLGDRRALVGWLLKFLRERGHAQCGKAELRDFFVFVREGGNNARGKPASEQTVSNYFRWLRPLFAFLVEAGELDISPYESKPRLSPPRVPKKQTVPFTPEQVRARPGRWPLRPGPP